jgi:hypothetical protein
VAVQVPAVSAVDRAGPESTGPEVGSGAIVEADVHDAAAPRPRVGRALATGLGRDSVRDQDDEQRSDGQRKDGPTHDFHCADASSASGAAGVGLCCARPAVMVGGSEAAVVMTSVVTAAVAVGVVMAVAVMVTAVVVHDAPVSGLSSVLRVTLP